MKRLSRFLEGEIFPLADIPPDMVEKLLSPSNLPYWKAAFTHESISRNIGENYDQFEKLGDAVLKTSYVNYLLERYPNLSSAQISSLASHYLEKKSLADISFKLKLPSYLETAMDISLSSSEDLFESLIGALFWIGNKIKLGVGFILADQFVRAVFSEIPLDMSITRGPAKTQLKEIFEALHWGGEPLVSWQQENPSLPGVLTLRFTPEALKFFREQGGNLSSDLLSKAEGASKKVAYILAAEKAINRLAKMGLTTEWAERYKRTLEMASPELSPYLPQLEKKANSEGFIDLYFKNAGRTNAEKTLQLIGELEGGETKILGSIKGKISENDGSLRKELILNYLGK